MGIRLLNLLALGAAMLAILSPQAAHAMNLGTLQREYSATLAPGDVKIFTLLFWNAESEPYDVAIRAASAPHGWTVVASPKEFSLGPSPPGKTEYIYLPGLKKTVAAKIVEIYVEAPKVAAPGNYTVIVDAASGRASGGAVNVVGERRFVFKTGVTGSALPESADGPDGASIHNGPAAAAGDIGAADSGVPEGKGGERMLLLVAAVFILACSWVIYRL